MTTASDMSGLAALAICESLLLALNARKILPEIEILGVLVDAAAAHANAPSDSPSNGSSGGQHAEVAALIQRIIDSGASVGRR